MYHYYRSSPPPTSAHPHSKNSREVTGGDWADRQGGSVPRECCGAAVSTLRTWQSGPPEQAEGDTSHSQPWFLGGLWAHLRTEVGCDPAQRDTRNLVISTEAGGGKQCTELEAQRSPRQPLLRFGARAALGEQAAGSGCSSGAPPPASGRSREGCTGRPCSPSGEEILFLTYVLPVSQSATGFLASLPLRLCPLDPSLLPKA